MSLARSLKLAPSVVATWIACAVLVALVIAGAGRTEEGHRHGSASATRRAGAETNKTVPAPSTTPAPAPETAPPGTSVALPTSGPATSTAPTSTAEGSVDALTVAPNGEPTGYRRDRFGHWIDADHDGCDTRAEVLIDESSTPAQVDPAGCVVRAGDWVSLYDGYTTDDPSELEIDHVVPLAEAWASGASAWDDARREQFANDLGELRAVTAAANRSKGDRDPAAWQPPNRGAWCTYAAQWVAVKVRWHLSADPAEVAALRNMLRGCP